MMTSGGRAKRRNRLSTRTGVLCLAGALFLLLCVLPVFYMFGLSFFDSAGNLNFEHYHRLLAEPRQRELLRNSVLLGSGTAVLATLIGAPLGLWLARAEVRGKAWWRLADGTTFL